MICLNIFQTCPKRFYNVRCETTIWYVRISRLYRKKKDCRNVDWYMRNPQTGSYYSIDAVEKGFDSHGPRLQDCTILSLLDQLSHKKIDLPHPHDVCI